MREAKRAKAEAINELVNKKMYKMAFSQVTMKLNNVEAELEQARHRADAASGKDEVTKQEIKRSTSKFGSPRSARRSSPTFAVRFSLIYGERI